MVQEIQVVHGVAGGLCISKVSGGFGWLMGGLGGSGFTRFHLFSGGSNV